MSRSRMAVTGLGVLIAGYGAWLLLSRGRDHLDIAIWLGAGVLLHDGLIALAALAAGVVVLRFAPTRVRGPLAAGLIVLSTVTVAAIPVLGRFGERADNPTLLPRDYTLGWLVFALAVLLAVAVGTLVGSRGRSRGE
jgi:hypothetical protein